jgi:hypothetical protein
VAEVVYLPEFQGPLAFALVALTIVHFLWPGSNLRTALLSVLVGVGLFYHLGSYEWETDVNLGVGITFAVGLQSFALLGIKPDSGKMILQFIAALIVAATAVYAAPLVMIAGVCPGGECF